MQPLNIAHRGGADLWPENTLEAFAKAIESGCDGIEFDLHLSADGQLIVHHDARLKPDATRHQGQYLAPPTPHLNQLSRAALAAYDVGRLDPTSPYGQRRATQQPMDGAQIPDFAELCALVRDTAPANFRLYAELKTDMGRDAQAGKALADRFVAALQASGLADNTVVISFDWRALARVRDALPELAHAYTTMEFSLTDPAHQLQPDAGDQAIAIQKISAAGAPWWGAHDWRTQTGDNHGEKILRAIAAAGGTGWFAHWQDVTPATMALAAQLGITVSAWTVNQPADMQHLADLGVAAIITDRPDLLAAISAPTP